jgi:hypothetical protein
MSGILRKVQALRDCPRCGEPMEFQKLTPEAGELVVPGLRGYRYCVACGITDTRAANQVYPSDFLTMTTSNAALVGVSADTLTRLRKKLHGKAVSLDFMISDFGQLISHPSSMSAFDKVYQDRKHIERMKRGENGGCLIVWNRR